MSDMVVSPLLFFGACVGCLLAGAIIVPLMIFWKVPEAKFFSWLRFRKAIWVRVHHSNDVEMWYDGYLGPEGLIVQDKKGRALAINPEKLNRGKNSYHQGKQIVDVGSNSLWPVGGREGVLVNMVEDYINDVNNNCPKLRGMEILARHTLLHSKDTDLPNKIMPMTNIDPASIIVDTNGMTDDEATEAYKKEYYKAVGKEIQDVIAEVHKVKAALEGKVVFDAPFSWADACFTVNSQLQPEILGKFKMLTEKLAYDADKNKEKFWTYLCGALLIIGAIIIGIVAVVQIT